MSNSLGLPSDFHFSVLVPGQLTQLSLMPCGHFLQFGLLLLRQIGFGWFGGLVQLLQESVQRIALVCPGKFLSTVLNRFILCLARKLVFLLLRGEFGLMRLLQRLRLCDVLLNVLPAEIRR